MGKRDNGNILLITLPDSLFPVRRVSLVGSKQEIFIWEWIELQNLLLHFIQRVKLDDKPVNDLRISVAQLHQIPHDGDLIVFLAINDDVYLYTGVTSLTSDESLTGFTLINMRTKEAKYYTISGAKESSAQTSAEGLVQQYKYVASFPLLLNVDGEPTYFMSLKDSSNLVKMYALVNVGQYSIGAVGASLTECIENYLSVLSKNGIKLNVSTDNITEEDSTTPSGGKEPETIEVTGKITDIRTAVIGGESVYYFKLDSSDSYYSVKASDAEQVIIFNKGDTVTFTVNTKDGSIIPVTKVK